MQTATNTAEKHGPEPYCCVIDCPQPAVVRIYDTRPETPYDAAETHACADHVGELGGEEPWCDVYRFNDDTPLARVIR